MRAVILGMCGCSKSTLILFVPCINKAYNEVLSVPFSLSGHTMGCRHRHACTTYSRMYYLLVRVFTLICFHLTKFVGLIKIVHIAIRMNVLAILEWMVNFLAV